MWEARAPGGRRRPRPPGFRQPWLLVLLVESWPCVRAALTSVCPGRGLWMALCLSWPFSLLSLAPPLPPSGRIWSEPRQGWAPGWAAGLSLVAQNPGPVQSRGTCNMRLFLSPDPGRTPSFHFRLSFSQFIQLTPSEDLLRAGWRDPPSRAVEGQQGRCPDQSGLVTDRDSHGERGPGG